MKTDTEFIKSDLRRHKKQQQQYVPQHSSAVGSQTPFHMAGF